MTMDDIVRHNTRAGLHFFSPDTMRFFSTRLCPASVATGPGGVFFVTSDRASFSGAARLYTVRQYHPLDGRCESVCRGEHHTPVRRSSRKVAFSLARLLASGDKIAIARALS